MSGYSLASAPPRFYVKVTPDSADCWRWLGSTTEKGYPRYRSGGKNVRAHRFAYEWFVGPIPDGLQLDHLCRVRDCVNPAHLELVTPAENTRRGLTGIQNARKTHCPQGHEYTPENTGTMGATRNQRYCRTCKRLRGLERKL